MFSKDDIKIYLKEIWCHAVDRICLAEHHVRDGAVVKITYKVENLLTTI